MNIKRAAIGAALVVLLPTVPALAQADRVRAGKWEYTVATQLPGMPQLPPGVTLPPGVKLPPGVTLPQQGAGGMTTTHTTCVADGDPTAELRRPHSPNSQCRVDRMERGGGTVVWSTTCTTPNGTVQSEGSGRYTNENMEVTVKSRTIAHPGTPPLEVTNHVVGRYTGPCDSR